AGGLFETRPGLQGQIVLMSDAGDSGSSATFDQAKGAVLDSKAVFFGVTTSGNEGSKLNSIAAATGGQILAANNPQSIPDSVTTFGNWIQNEYVVTWTSHASEPIDLSIHAGGLITSAIGVARGAVVTGATSHPSLVKPSKAPSFLTKTTGKYVV